MSHLAYSPWFEAQERKLRLVTCGLRATGVKTTGHRFRCRPFKQACHPNLLPVLTVEGRLDDVVVLFGPDPKPDGTHLCSDRLCRPVRILTVGDNRAQATGAI